MVHQWMYNSSGRWSFPSSKKVPVPVISVGNIVWGGTGKTPIVQSIAKAAIERGLKPLIVSRGYRGGDEARFHAHRIPNAIIACGRDRVKTIRRALKVHAGDLHVVIVDDGFQHYRLQRDVDILMLHAMHPFGLNGKLIPQGTLREVPRRGLARADVVVIHHADKVSVRRLCALDRYVRKWSSASVLVVRSVFRPKDLIRIGAGDHRRQVVSLQHVRNRKVVAVSAIASSGNFHSVLRQLGADILSECSFEDHHAFTEDELVRVVTNAQLLSEEEVMVVTTEKDLYRDEAVMDAIASGLDCEVLVLTMSLGIVDTDEQQVMDIILQRAFSCR